MEVSEDSPVKVRASIVELTGDGGEFYIELEGSTED